MAATSFPAASSRCWPSPAHCSPTRSLLILDEPTEGLAPIMVRQIHGKLAELKAEGATIILVEQNFGFATSLADDVAIIGRGRKVWSGRSEMLRADKDVQAKWLGV